MYDAKHKRPACTLSAFHAMFLKDHPVFFSVGQR